MNFKIKQITIGRTISMANYQNEKQEVSIEVNYSDDEKLSDVIKAAYKEAEKVFLVMYPTYGGVNVNYKEHMSKVKDILIKEDSVQKPVTDKPF